MLNDVKIVTNSKMRSSHKLEETEESPHIQFRQLVPQYESNLGNENLITQQDQRLSEARPNHTAKTLERPTKKRKISDQ
jgi:hypothetical protein